jgi:hypothetical protein
MLRRDSRSSSLLLPAQPIQSPPSFRNKGFMALARPPELRSVIQPFSVFRNVSGSRFDTTIRRPPETGSKLKSLSPLSLALTSPRQWNWRIPSV